MNQPLISGLLGKMEKCPSEALHMLQKQISLQRADFVLFSSFSLPKRFKEGREDIPHVKDLPQIETKPISSL